MEIKEIYMNRAVDLAYKGAGHVSPNPMVGAVIVYNDRIIGEGYHARYGQEHAEVMALKNVREKHLLPMSTLYVTLEPCNHFGKTPPCTLAILQSGIKKVVIGHLDPNKKVSGNGKAFLEEHEVLVTELCQNKCATLNKRFFCSQLNQRPFVILKWAQTKRGYMATENKSPIIISNLSSRSLVHKMRSEEDAVLVGFQTALHDNPKLNVRYWTGRNPKRIVIDPKHELPTHLHVFDKSQPTFILNKIINKTEDSLHYIKTDTDDIKTLLKTLNDWDIQSVLVEGGVKTLQNFINSGFWDEAYIFEGNDPIDKGMLAPKISLHGAKPLQIENDFLYYIQNQ